MLLEGILEEKWEIKAREEREKREIRNFEERRLAREFELERLRAQLRNKLNEKELKVEEGKELNVCRSSDCEVKVGVCEGRIRAVAMGAQQETETREKSPALDGEKEKSPALDRESMRGEPWLERTGRER
ncbi:hypothetical protein TNCV_314251 [Trichonephila clavipes]|nr:hypothetical protein TNCV_314251 [Trichonephila clavipes]